MRLSELKKLVDKAHERMAKFREDPQVALYFLENGPGEQRHHLLHVEYAEIVSTGNLDSHSMDLLCSHEIEMQPEMRSLFILGDDADEEVLH
ncbi:hypothetical protein hairong_160 [Pseudomonas phage hairong]|nr:hypothetical protein hairong_160 [Pseudomonas phage hairong]